MGAPEVCNDNLLCAFSPTSREEGAVSLPETQMVKDCGHRGWQHCLFFIVSVDRVGIVWE